MCGKVESLLAHFPAVIILGVRQCGKTTLARQLRPDWHYIDLERVSDYEQVSHDPEFFFQRYPRNVIIDEAQSLPVLFNLLRGVIDEQRQTKNRFIITGSSSPELLQHVSESLAGRVAIVQLGTLKACEIADKPLSEFYQLFGQPLSRDYLPRGKAPLLQQEVHRAWLRGGYPEPIAFEDQRLFSEWMDNYRETYVNRDIAALFPRLNKITYQRFLTTLGKLSGAMINKAELARNIEISESTVKDYFDIADGTFLWRKLPAYHSDSRKSLVKMPRGHLRDSGLLHHLLKIPSEEMLYADPRVGASFESFVIEELLKGLETTLVSNWDSTYYRTRSGAEIDLILDGPFGLLPIEIKYGVKTELKKLVGLQQFVRENQLAFGLLINQATEARWLTPEIYQLPVGWL